MTARKLSFVAGAAMATFFIGFAIAYALPLFDPSLSTPTEFTLDFSKPMLAGKEVYDAQGCYFCHTQAVRPVSNDLGLGRVSLADRYVKDADARLGLVRVGPDLTCVGDRYENQADLISHLTNPRATVPGSNMPRYDFLDDEELTALAGYLRGLSCEGT